MKQFSFKKAERFVQNKFQHFCQIADQLLKQNNEIYLLVFNYVVFIDFYVCFVDSFVIIKYTIVYCRIMYVHDVIKCVFLFLSKFPDNY